MLSVKNPIMTGFFPDPSICRVGNKFYTVHSTFAYFPGVPVFESEDLVHWNLISNVLDVILRFLCPAVSIPRGFLPLPFVTIRAPGI